VVIAQGTLPSTFEKLGKKVIVDNNSINGYIQGLIDNASAGDTIYVPSGIYYENIIINKSISLIGEDKNTTIIDGKGGAMSVAHISADWVNVSGFSIQNGSNYYVGGIELCSNNVSIFANNIMDNQGSGIAIYSYYQSSNNNITNNKISNNSCGIMMLTNLYTNICDNIIRNNNDGISLEYCGYSLIKNNIIKDNNFGLSLIDSSFNIIRNNIISEGGLRVGGWYGSGKNTISNNIFYNTGLSIGYDEWGKVDENYVKDNIVNGKPLVYLYNKSDKTISNQSGQILLINCNNISIQNQNISKTNTGIYLINSVDCYIINNNIRFNNECIRLLIGSDRNIIENNTITNNQEGIYEYWNHDNYIINNYVSHNEIGYIGQYVFNTIIIGNRIENNSVGIRIGSFAINSYCRLIENKISNNGIGLDITKTKNSIFEYNTNIKNEVGFQLSRSHNNSIKNNKISSNQKKGISLIDSHDNILTENIITENEDGIEFNRVIM
jgi:parallel beta-helix repeat protein